jgi:hypothetical protein
MVASLLGASSLLLAGTLHASDVIWADPLPNTPAVKATDAVPAVPATATTPAIPAKPAVAAKPATGGIGYEWTVTLGNNDSAEFVGSVGAKSSWEPSNAEATMSYPTGPEAAWQHTSDWVALDLTTDADVTIMVMAQQGVTDASIVKDSNPAALAFKVAGNLLYPAVSVFKNWEETGQEIHRFNPIGKSTWTNELVYMGVAYADKGQRMIEYKGKFTKGHYSLAIGGAAVAPGNNCTESNTACYTGSHGYLAQITTGTGAADHVH